MTTERATAMPWDEALHRLGNLAIDVTAVIAFLMILGRGARKWIEREIVKPLKAAHDQVTVNNHSMAKPTVLDRISDVEIAIGKIASAQKDADARAQRIEDQVATQKRWDSESFDRLVKMQVQVSELTTMITKERDDK